MDGKEKGDGAIDRRGFLRLGLAGTAAFIGLEQIADAAQAFIFPDPVYRTLGRTGLKITTVSFGAMLTPEPEVIRYALDHGVNYVDTARVYMDGRNEEIVAPGAEGEARQGLRGDQGPGLLQDQRGDHPGCRNEPEDPRDR